MYTTAVEKLKNFCVLILMDTSKDAEDFHPWQILLKEDGTNVRVGAKE